MDQKIKELADSFFEWPTENKSFVTLTSALLFAEKIAELKQGETDGERDRYRVAMEKVMEMRMVLDMMMRSVLTVEEAQRGLEIAHRDLTRQAEWVKGEIRKAQPSAV